MEGCVLISELLQIQGTPSLLYQLNSTSARNANLPQKSSYSYKNCQINQNLEYFESHICGKPLDAPTEMHWKCDGVTRKCEIHGFVVTSPSNHVMVEVIKRKSLEMRLLIYWQNHTPTQTL